MNIKRTYIKNLNAGDRFVLVPNTVYVATHVKVGAAGSGTSVTYMVEGSHITTETTFTRPSLTTVEVL